MRTLAGAKHAMKAFVVWCSLCGLLIAQQPSKEKPPGQTGAKTENEASATLISQDEPPEVTPERPMSFWMARKLEYSKSILEALTAGDFDVLATDAKRMKTLGRIEGLVRRKSESYRDQLRAFDLATQELGRQAARKNAEGAALAFNQLTNSCVSCHVLLREGVD